MWLVTLNSVLCARSLLLSILPALQGFWSCTGLAFAVSFSSQSSLHDFSSVTRNARPPCVGKAVLWVSSGTALGIADLWAGAEAAVLTGADAVPPRCK